MPQQSLAVIRNDRERKRKQLEKLKRAVREGKHTRDELLRYMFGDRLKNLVNTLKEDGEMFMWPPGNKGGEYYTYHLEAETVEEAEEINWKHQLDVNERRRDKWRSQQRTASS